MDVQTDTHTHRTTTVTLAAHARRGLMKSAEHRLLSALEFLKSLNRIYFSRFGSRLVSFGGMAWLKSAAASIDKYTGCDRAGFTFAPLGAEAASSPAPPYVTFELVKRS